jgi:iron complex transport system substrate-binding protein
MRGKIVTVPADPERVAIYNVGFLAQLARALDVSDKIVVTGGMKTKWETNPDDTEFLYLNPEFSNLPDMGYRNTLNLETLAFSNADLVIWEQTEYTQMEKFRSQDEEAINTIENTFHIPVVVVKGTGIYGNKDLQPTYDTVTILGDIFNKQDRAKEINNLVKTQADEVKNKVADVKETPKTLYIGLKNETTGIVWGENYGDGKFASKYAKVKNIIPESISKDMSAEQIISMNPDMIVLTTWDEAGYDPDVFTKNKDYSALRDVKAVKDGKVVSFGKLTWWGDFGLSMPIMMLITAKGAHPEAFEDINVRDLTLTYLKKLYNLSDDESTHLLDEVMAAKWMKDKNF